MTFYFLLDAELIPFCFQLALCLMLLLCWSQSLSHSLETTIVGGHYFFQMFWTMSWVRSGHGAKNTTSIAWRRVFLTGEKRDTCKNWTPSVMCVTWWALWVGWIHTLLMVYFCAAGSIRWSCLDCTGSSCRYHRSFAFLLPPKKLCHYVALKLCML